MENGATTACLTDLASSELPVRSTEGWQGLHQGGGGDRNPAPVAAGITTFLRTRTPGDDIHFEEAGEIMRLVPANVGAPREGLDVEARLRLFDAATERQRNREGGRASSRDWTREELYERGHADPD